MRKTVQRKKARSKKPTGKRGKSSKSAGKSKRARRTAAGGGPLAAAVFDPAKLEIQSRLEAAAFERLTPGLNLSAADVAPSPLPPGQIRFRLLRPEDLLVMEIETTDLQFESPSPQDAADGGAPHLVPSGSKGGLLTAIFGYQHAAEKALFEVNDVPGPPEPGDDIPIAARAAHKSRLVFKVPKGERIAFSIDGIVAAMSRLEMAVAPVATPRPAKTIGSIPIGAALIELASGLGLAADQDGQLFLQQIASTRSAARTRAKSGARSARKQAVSTASLIAAAQAMHDLRARASQASIVDARAETGHTVNADGAQHRIGAFKAAAGVRVSRHQAAQTERRRDRDRSPLPPVHLTKRAERLDPCAKGGRSACGYDADRTLAFAAWCPQHCHEWRRHHRRTQPAAEDHPCDLGARPGSSTDTDRFFNHRSVPAIAGWSFSRQPRAAELRDVHEAHHQSRTRDRARACAFLQRSVAGPLRTMGYDALCKQIELSHPVLGSSGYHGTRPVCPRGSCRLPLPFRPQGRPGPDYRAQDQGSIHAACPHVSAEIHRRLGTDQILHWTRSAVQRGPARSAGDAGSEGSDDPAPTEALQSEQLFWPNDANGLFRWKLHARDQEGKAVRLHAPLLFVAEGFSKPGTNNNRS